MNNEIRDKAYDSNTAGEYKQMHSAKRVGKSLNSKNSASES